MKFDECNERMNTQNERRSNNHRENEIDKIRPNKHNTDRCIRVNVETFHENLQSIR